MADLKQSVFSSAQFQKPAAAPAAPPSKASRQRESPAGQAGEERQQTLASGGDSPGAESSKSRQQAIRAAALVLRSRLADAEPDEKGADAGAAPPTPSSPAFLARLERAIATEKDEAVQYALDLVGDAKTLAIHVGQVLEVLGAKAIGVAELAGLRYPVKAYEAQVDGGLYRGSRLDDAAIAALEQHGIKAVVNLCLENDDDTPRAATLGLATLHLPILDNSVPTVDQMRQFIEFVRANGPAYVHCEAGKGRTGVAVACYRIAVGGWTAAQAIEEGRRFGLQLVNQIEFIEQFAQLVHGQAAV